MIIPVQDKCIEDDCVLEQLMHIFVILEEQLKLPNFDPYRSFQLASGFQISRKPSSIPGAGTGVFVTAGKVSKGQVVAIYPGSVYRPMDFIFFQSIGNSFIFRCKDRFHIDGKDNGISKSIYKSCALREKLGTYEMCDMTWLTESPLCIMNIGQYVNNQTQDFPANVQYQEVNLSKDFPFTFRRFIPNIFVNGNNWMPFLRTVVLVANRSISAGEEVLSTYFTAVE